MSVVNYVDHISIHYNGRPDMPVWLEMSGQGCRVYETYGNNDWFGLCYFVLTNENAKMTRIDIAYDDFNGLLDLDLIEKDVSTGSWVARCKKISVLNDFTRNCIVGKTITAGQRGSNIPKSFTFD